MRGALVGLAGLLVTLSAAMANNATEWEDYKVTYNKSYATPEEEAIHYTIFLESKKLIEEHNAKYEQGLVSYSMGINQFSDMTSEERKSYLGVNRGKP